MKGDGGFCKGGGKQIVPPAAVGEACRLGDDLEAEAVAGARSGVSLWGKAQDDRRGIGRRGGLLFPALCGLHPGAASRGCFMGCIGAAQ
jgi:hypothetical protein